MPKVNALAFKVRFYDYYGKTSHNYEDIKEFLFCLNYPIDHLEIIRDGEDWPDVLSEVIDQEKRTIYNAMVIYWSFKYCVKSSY